MRKKMKCMFLGVLAFSLSLCAAGIFGVSLKSSAVASATTTATVNKMNFEEGASVRTTAENMGIRFTANYDASIYELVESGAGKVGMIIVPEKALSEATGDYFNYLQTQFDKTPASVSTEFTVEYFTDNEDGTYQARGAIINLLDENLVYEYQAVAYYYTETDGYTYSEKSDVRTISYVTNAALQDDELTEEQRVDTLHMATTLSQKLEDLNKTSDSDFYLETTVEKGIELSCYISKDKTIASATLNGNAIEVLDNQITLTKTNISDNAQVLKIIYSDNSTLNINVIVSEDFDEFAPGEGGTTMPPEIELPDVPVSWN